VGIGGRRRAWCQLDDQCRHAWIASDAADRATATSLPASVTASTIWIMGLSALPPFGQPPVDEYLNLGISQELALQIRIDLGAPTGHDEQIARHFPLSKRPGRDPRREGCKPEAL